MKHFKSVRLSDAQISAVEIYITDIAHQIDPEYVYVSALFKGDRLVIPLERHKFNRLFDVLTDANNSADADPDGKGACRSLNAVQNHLVKIMKKDSDLYGL